MKLAELNGLAAYVAIFVLLPLGGAYCEKASHGRPSEITEKDRAEMEAGYRSQQKEDIKLARRVYGNGNPEHLEALGSQLRQELYNRERYGTE